MMSFSERRNALSALLFQAQVAFAARLGERSLAECRLIRSELVTAYPCLQQGVDLVWRHALHQDVDFERDAEAIHNTCSKLIPETENDVVPDQALRFASKAICLGLLITLWPEKSGKYAVSAGGAMVNLVGTVYDIDEVKERERRWQDRAIELLQANRDKPISRSMFDELPEYERPPISESYKTGSNE